MRKLEYCTAIILALLAVALDVWLFRSRCLASPEINPSTLSLGLLIQATAVGLPLLRTAWFDSASAAHGLKILGAALILFVGSAQAIRYSVLYSDKIGQPNYFKSVGLRCG
jgi:hypothetical protein